MSLTTELTIYEAAEMPDDNGKATGAYKLIRKSLEAGAPYLLSCDHTHATATEALACSYFRDKKTSRSLSPLNALA